MCFPRYSSQVDSIRFCENILADCEVLVSPGRYFGMEGHFRLTCVKPECELRAGLDALSSFLRKNGRGG